MCVDIMKKTDENREINNTNDQKCFKFEEFGMELKSSLCVKIIK